MADVAISASRRLAANLIWLLHFFLLTYPLYAWAMPNLFRWTSIILIVVVQLHWATYDGKCILTEAEAYLRGESETLHGRIVGEDVDFFRGLFALIGIDLTSSSEMRIINTLSVVLTTLAVLGIAGYIPVLIS